MWGLLRLGYVDLVTARLRSAPCDVARLLCSEPAKRHGRSPIPTDTPAATYRPPAGGTPGAARHPASGIDLPWPLIGGGAAVFALFWWDVPRRLRRHYGSAPKTARDERRAEERRRARLALSPDPAEAAKDVPPEIAGITPGIAAKGMRVSVRTCEITLRPGADGAVVLAKTLVRTGAREFAAASRVVRRYLGDPAFVAALIEETGRAVAYVDQNPQLAGAAARRSELRSLLTALEGIADGQSR